MALFTFFISLTGRYSITNPRETNTLLTTAKLVSDLPVNNVFRTRYKAKAQNIKNGVFLIREKSAFSITDGNATSRIINKILGNERAYSSNGNIKNNAENT
ncbi:hypothetical protein ULMA_07890 [Patiriisocius marinus]|uniref:Uncharacterized protein n=1 Tax=Patiriisocius marinus TaxID=1397112 RepID=A0A5J4IYN9_9FLAO|nr:hypothetical protein ULMA_07890 [Patiriisocius marinus]